MGTVAAMQLFLIYDIANDRIRTKVAIACEDYGLDRIQYSAFAGRLSRTHQEELMLKIRRLLGCEAGRVQLIPVGQSEWEKRLEVDNGD
jgi:CRISPR-associated protein Cas2